MQDAGGKRIAGADAIDDGRDFIGRDGVAARASDYVNGAVIPVDGSWLAR